MTSVDLSMWLHCFGAKFKTLSVLKLPLNLQPRWIDFACQQSHRPWKSGVLCLAKCTSLSNYTWVWLARISPTNSQWHFYVTSSKFNGHFHYWYRRPIASSSHHCFPSAFLPERNLKQRERKRTDKGTGVVMYKASLMYSTDHILHFYISHIHSTLNW